MNGQRIIGILGTQLLKVTLKIKFYLVGNIECGHQITMFQEFVFLCCCLTSLIFLSAPCLSLQLDVARYACVPKLNNLLDNKTKYVQASMSDLGLTKKPENTLKIVRNREEVFWLIWLVGECEKVQIVTYGQHLDVIYVYFLGKSTFFAYLYTKFE